MNRPMATHRRKPGSNPFKAKRVIKKAERPAAPIAKEPNRFRVLIAVNRPRYRSRAERAVDLPGWEMRSLLNKEDPIGLMSRKPPHILILSADFGRNKTLGFLKASQRFRSEQMKLIGIFEDEEAAEGADELCDATFCPPWKTAEMQAVAARLFEEIKGRAPIIPANDERGEPPADEQD